MGEEICLPSDVCLCAEVSQAKRHAGPQSGRMDLPQSTAGLRTVLVPCFRMQGAEPPHLHPAALLLPCKPFADAALPVLWAVRGSNTLKSRW